MIRNNMNNENFICNSRYFFVFLQKKLIELYYEENFEIHYTPDGYSDVFFL